MVTMLLHNGNINRILTEYSSNNTLLFICLNFKHFKISTSNISYCHLSCLLYQCAISGRRFDDSYNCNRNANCHLNAICAKRELTKFLPLELGRKKMHTAWKREKLRFAFKVQTVEFAYKVPEVLTQKCVFRLSVSLSIRQDALQFSI